MDFIRLKHHSVNVHSLLLIGFSCFSTTLSAMGLNEFVTDSIRAHPSILEKVHVFREVAEDKGIANSGWLPSVDLSATTGTFETKSPTTGGVQRDFESNRAELSITQNLFNGFDTEYQQEQTEARARSALYEVFDTADNIALEAVQAYLGLLKQQELVKLAEENVSSHERILSQIRERNNSGVGRKSELQQTEGRVARAHAGLIAQQNNFQDAATLLHSILGRYANLDELQLPEFPKHLDMSLEALTDMALERHPAIKVAAYNIQAALSDSSRARNTNYPRIDLRLAKEVGNDLNGFTGSTDQLSLVLNLNYNLFRGGADQAQKRKKISVVHQNQEFSAQVHRQVINTLRLAWMADRSLTSQIRYLNTHIVKARETVASYGEEFFIGQRDLIDLLDAEGELNTAKNEYAVAYYDELAARYRILEGMGMLFPALNLNVSVGDDNLQITELKSTTIKSTADSSLLLASKGRKENVIILPAKQGVKITKYQRQHSNVFAKQGFSLESDAGQILNRRNRNVIASLSMDIDNQQVQKTLVNSVVAQQHVMNENANSNSVKPKTLTATAAEINYQLIAIEAKGNDTLPLNDDRDLDKEIDDTDHCQNTKKKDSVDNFGCQHQRAVVFGYDAVNEIPVVGDDLLELEMNSVLVITQQVLLENDTDADNDELRLIDFTQPENGDVAFDDKKNIIYRVAEGFIGNDQFSYTITDGKGAVVTANVKLSVVPKTDMKLTKTQFVNYIYKSSKLTKESQNKVQGIVDMIKNLPHVDVEIYAYTDNVANDRYNLALSERRAKATRNLLMSFGINGNRIKGFGMGEKNPIADNSTEEGRAINRRGEIQFNFGTEVKKTGVLLPKHLN